MVLREMVDDQANVENLLETGLGFPDLRNETSASHSQCSALSCRTPCHDAQLVNTVSPESSSVREDGRGVVSSQSWKARAGDVENETRRDRGGAATDSPVCTEIPEL